MKKIFTIAGIGEVLWDMLPDGRQLGGSPLNVAWHCQQAGMQGIIISALGDDSDGQKILELLRHFRMKSGFVQIHPDYPTGKVTVSLTDGIPDFMIHPEVAWDYIVWQDHFADLAQSVDAVAFGSLAQRGEISRQTIHRFIRTMRPDALRVFDINLRQHYHSKELIVASLELANVLKINDEELPVLCGYLGIDTEPSSVFRHLSVRFGIEMLAYTKGAFGSELITAEVHSVMGTPPVQIVDTVGAGDAFTGYLIAGILQRKEIREMHHQATQAAAKVCEQAGAFAAIAGMKS